MSTRAGSHLKAQMGKDLFPSLCSCWSNSGPWGLLVWVLRFLTNHWPKATLSSLPCGLLQDVLLARWKSQSYGTKSLKWHPITFPVFYLSQILLTFKRRGLHKSLNTKRQRSLGAILMSAHHCVFIQYVKYFQIQVICNFLSMECSSPRNHMTGSFSSFKYQLKHHCLRDLTLFKFQNILFVCMLSVSL